ncbi:PHB depolymerase family esterase [Luteimonas sp. MC1828]|uniref:extracellular catalytic domain type 1 short-chain-length polyhydroxyalkanoate depolymerase n=1 Tax=Luteimonas sp. MC1828 TaxID=2799787 RepID=UPI0018F1D57A|nr:PHB depolymerase family esterase [Luteimonas sp. MC1828]MBJ7573851.1 PHB depolymerase family esterase [Luteimonas sp. MC1828]
MTPANNTMRQAMRLMQAGDLQAATRTIQDALGGNAGAAPAASEDGGHDVRGNAAARGPYIEGEFRVVEGGKAQTAGVPSKARGGRDSRHRFSCDAGALDYRLHIPAGLDTAGAPLLVMLHGCTQTPEDFARGTRMNELAGEQGYVVAWPAQSAQRNQNRCWNWFRGSDQQREQGEPAILAALTRDLVASHRLDAGRVYVAGLSAGGAMAAVLASTHPDIYAAIGVHSGLPIGMASDVPSAFAAMRNGGGRSRGASAAGTAPVPAIVFHGDSDTTVHPGNGHGVVEQSLGRGRGAGGAAAASTVERTIAPGGRSATRTVHRTADGRIAAEHWVIHGAGHAWAGGDAAGTYTDPQGPDASAEMLRFFAGCRNA